MLPLLCHLEQSGRSQHLFWGTPGFSAAAQSVTSLRNAPKHKNKRGKPLYRYGVHNQVSKNDGICYNRAVPCPAIADEEWLRWLEPIFIKNPW